MKDIIIPIFIDEDKAVQKVKKHAEDHIARAMMN